MMNFAGCRGLWDMGFMGGGMFFYGIIILSIILAVAYFIGNNHSKTRSSALEILDQEYAKGNVSDDDYLKRKNNLK